MYLNSELMCKGGTFPSRLQLLSHLAMAVARNFTYFMFSMFLCSALNVMCTHLCSFFNVMLMSDDVSELKTELKLLIKNYSERFSDKRFCLFS